MMVYALKVGSPSAVKPTTVAPLLRPDICMKKVLTHTADSGIMESTSQLQMTLSTRRALYLQPRGLVLARLRARTLQLPTGKWDIPWQHSHHSLAPVRAN